MTKQVVNNVQCNNYFFTVVVEHTTRDSVGPVTQSTIIENGQVIKISTVKGYRDLEETLEYWSCKARDIADHRFFYDNPSA